MSGLLPPCSSHYLHLLLPPLNSDVRWAASRLTTLAENGVLINGVNLVPLFLEVLTRTLCNKPLFYLKVLKNDRFLSQDHEIIKRFYMVNTFSLKSLFYFEKPCKACFA